MVRKKEDPEKVRARVRKYLETRQQLLITGLSSENKDTFTNLYGIEDLSHGKKLVKLMDFWNKNHSPQVTSDSQFKTILGVPVKIESSTNFPEISETNKGRRKVPKEEKTSIDTGLNFEKEFGDFLLEFKKTNQFRPRLREHGTLIRDELEENSTFKKALEKICRTLPENSGKTFRTMYLHGYFYLYEKELIEIADYRNAEQLQELLFKTLQYIESEDPLSMAKKKLGLR